MCLVSMLVVYWVSHSHSLLAPCPFRIFRIFVGQNRSDIIPDSERLRERVSCFVSNPGSLKKKNRISFPTIETVMEFCLVTRLRKLLVKHLASIMFRRFVSRRRNEMKCIQKSIETLHGSRLLWGVSQEFAKNQ